MSEIGMTQSITLPSKGLLYPQDHPFHMKENVQINLLSGTDENLLTTKSLIQSGELIDKLLKKVLIDKVDTNTLLVGDKTAILIFLRIYSLGTEYKAIGRCEYCNATDKYTFDISQVPIKTLGESAKQINKFENRFSFTTSSGVEIEFKLATVGDSSAIERDIESERKFNKKSKIVNATDKLISHTYRHLILSIDKDDRREKIDSFLQKSILESREFRKHLKDITPTVEFTGDFLCTECGKDNVDVPLDFNENFFWSDF